MIRLTRRGGRQWASATPGRSSRRSGQNASRGMVTVEMAVSLITAALVVVASCWVVGLVVVEDACRTTAAQVARQVARGDTASARQAERHAPTGAQVSTRSSGGWVEVTVQVERSLGRLGPVHLRGQARSPMEPGES